MEIGQRGKRHTGGMSRGKGRESRSEAMVVEESAGEHGGGGSRQHLCQSRRDHDRYPFRHVPRSHQLMASCPWSFSCAHVLCRQRPHCYHPAPRSHPRGLRRLAAQVEDPRLQTRLCVHAHLSIYIYTKLYLTVLKTEAYLSLAVLFYIAFWYWGSSANANKAKKWSVFSDASRASLCSRSCKPLKDCSAPSALRTAVLETAAQGWPHARWLLRLFQLLHRPS